MGPRKRHNDSLPNPLVSGEYMDMLRQFKRDNKRQRKEHDTEPSTQQAGNASGLSAAPATADHFTIEATPSPPAAPLPNISLGYDSDSDSDFDEAEFEDVELENSDDEQQPSTEMPPNDDVVVSLDGSRAAHLSRKPRQKGLSKPKRLLLHKISLSAWIYHVRVRNKWLLSPQLLSNPVLSNILPQSVMVELYPPEHLTSFSKSRQFIEGLRHAMEVWQHRFRVVRPGLACNQDVNSGNFGDSGFYEEYVSQLLSLTGSVDLEAQGFVALLRSLGLTTRLVCSLQPPDNLSVDNVPGGTVSNTATASSCPIFWSEVWDVNVKKWVAVDTVTSTVRLPTRNKVKLKLEPPQSDRYNVLRYCVALNHKNQVRDVTRRYSSNYNARTRKKRLPHFEPEEWLDRFLGQFAPKEVTATDKDELAELARYPRLEGIPTRVQDFVGHPEYALVDQLRHNEVLRPGAQPCGILSAKTKTNLGKGMAKPNYIYNRDDVLTARSGQSWYKRGRSIKVGAQPRSRREHKNRLTGETESVALYTHDQTELYVPPPVEPDGTVPKSQYRTIDVFTDSMIPEGACYIKSKLGTQAAKLLKVDFANVVTGVDFGKGGPKSRMFGIMVAKMYAPAVQEVISELHELEAENMERNEELRILMLWRKFIMGVQIWERVEKMNPSFTESGALNDEDANNAHEIDNGVGDNHDDDDTHRGDNNSDTKYDPLSRPIQSDIQASPQKGTNKTNALDPVKDEDSDLEITNEKKLGSSSVPAGYSGSRAIANSGNLRYFTINPSALSGMRFSPCVNATNNTAQSSHGLSAETVNASKGGSHANLHNRTEPSSPDSYHSFSDLDVDEISESDL